MLYELTQDLGNSLSLQEALAFVGVRLKRLIPYDTIAISHVHPARREAASRNTSAATICGCSPRSRFRSARAFRDVVAENNKPILNGNPSVEAGYLNDPTKYSSLRSALAVPLNGVNGPLGVLALPTGRREMRSVKRTCAFC